MENVTVFEDCLPKAELSQDDGMDIDEAGGTKGQHSEEDTALTGQPNSENAKDLKPSENVGKRDKDEPDGDNGQESVPDMDTLYPVFWKLQYCFSTPTRLFDNAHFQSFKIGLDATLRKFKAVHQELQTRGTIKISDDNKRVSKRKRHASEDELSSSFNPRYLTSRDLFELEVRKSTKSGTIVYVLTSD